MDGSSGILDASVVVDLFRGKANVVERVRAITKAYVPTIVLGELYFGAYKSTQTAKRISEIKQLERTITILDVTRETSQIYGEIKNQLSAKGRPIPENDIWIAAISKEHRLLLITSDNHFDEVEDILIEKL
jgi:tRNA(fMet)-specific endonuclease VapC